MVWQTCSEWRTVIEYIGLSHRCLCERLLKYQVILPEFEHRMFRVYERKLITAGLAGHLTVLLLYIEAKKTRLVGGFPISCHASINPPMDGE